ncbi:uncharacterized protein TNIN_450781 [Trichonephila inaurata madagascariensis]|uniref:Uncharacterized protein n=1 Tax=Trichonephila inaurata madagascariensis TaxID=2747483 RepID=A0A8X6ICJ4_9ARAC|nr:uncharacterized protein TNIN_450781 [Trichonephila inaurata madagascariensis]
MGSEKSDEDMELPETTEKVLPLESERAKMLSVGLDAVAQPVTVPEEKVDVIKETAKEDINPVVLSKELVNLDDDEIEEVKQKVCFNPNLKASSNVIFVQHHWRKYSQVQRGGVEKPTRKLPFIQRPTMRRKRFKAKPVTCSQIMGQLPAKRISQSFPLSKVEIDFCGISGLDILIIYKEKES